eukprot:TRINITY_DN1122_c0_g1_i1.p1 TRINITY_DN1122_c0_g1~~TRINITY_DN1122_c0_g1_i1.p1  ORF type:complete len:2329 (-),score=412.59 TRINITY_DN1122_c0_g1_i1:67-7053(-)
MSRALTLLMCLLFLSAGNCTPDRLDVSTHSLHGVGSAGLQFNWGWLNKLIYNMSIPIDIPEISLGILGKVKVTDFVCSHPSIGDLNWGYANNKTLSVAASGVAIGCDGILSWGLINDATMKVVIDQAGLSTSLDFGFDNGFPNKTTTSDGNCKTNVNIASIDISGLAGKVVSAIVDLAKPIITSAIEKQVCPLVTPLVNTNLTQVLELADAMAQPFIAALPAPPKPLTPPEGTFDWSASPALGLLDAFLDFDTTKGTASERFDRLLDLILPGGSLNISDPGLLPPLKLNTSIANFTMSVVGGSVSGLDTADVFDVLEAVDQYSLSSAIAFRQLNISLQVFSEVQSNVAPDPPTSTILGLTLGLQGTSFSVTALIAILKSVFGHTHLSQLKDLSCVLAPLTIMNISKLDLEYDGLWIGVNSSDGDHDFSEIATSFANTAYDIVQASAPLIVTHLVGGAGREVINNLVQTVLSGVSCPPFVPEPQTFLEFDNSTLFSLIEKGVNLFGIKALNALPQNHTFNKFPPPPPTNGTHLALSEVYLGSLNNFTNLSLQPTGHYSVSTEIDHGDLNVQVDTIAAFVSSGVAIHDSPVLSLDVSKLGAMLDAIIKFDVSKIMDMPLYEITDLITWNMSNLPLSLVNFTDLGQIAMTVLSGINETKISGFDLTDLGALSAGVSGAPKVETTQVKPLSPSPAPPNMMDLTTSGFLRLLSVGVDLLPYGPLALLDNFIKHHTQDGNLTIPVDKELFQTALGPVNMSLAVGNLTLIGLDTLNSTGFDVAPQTIKVQLGMNGTFGAEADLQLAIIAHGQTSVFNLTVVFDVTDVQFDLLSQVGFDDAKFESLRLNQLEGATREACLLSALPVFQVNQLGFEYSKLDMGIAGLPSGLETSLINITDYLHRILTPAVVHNLFAGSVRDVLNAQFLLKQKSVQGICTPAPPKPPQYMDYEKSTILKWLHKGLSLLNSQGDKFVNNHMLATFNLTNHSLLGILNITDLVLGSLNTFNNLTFLEPRGPYQLWNNISHGAVNFSADTLVSVDNSSGVSINDTGSFAAEVGNIAAAVDLLLKWDTNYLMEELAVSDFTSMFTWQISPPKSFFNLSQIVSTATKVGLAVVEGIDEVGYDHPSFVFEPISLVMSKVSSPPTVKPLPEPPSVTVPAGMFDLDVDFNLPNATQLNNFMKHILGGGANPNILNMWPESTIFYKNLVVAQVKLVLSNASVHGLTGFKKSDFLKYNNSLFESEIQVEQLLVDLAFSLQIVPLFDSPFAGQGYIHNFTVSVGLDDMHTKIDGVLALVEEKLLALQVGQLLEKPNRMPCLLSLLDPSSSLQHLQLNYTKLILGVSNIRPDFESAINTLIARATGILTPPVVYNLLNGFGRKFINKKIASSRQQNGTCSSIPSAQEYVDFQLMFSKIKTVSDNVRSLFRLTLSLDSALEDIMGILNGLETSKQQRHLHFNQTTGDVKFTPENPIAIDLPVPAGTPPFRVGVTQLEINHLNTFEDEWIHADDAYDFQSHVAIKNMTFTLGLELDYNMSHSNTTQQLASPVSSHSAFTVAIDIGEMKFDLGAQLMLNRQKLDALQLTELTKVSCLASSLDAAALASPHLQFEDIHLTLSNQTDIYGFEALQEILEEKLSPALLKAIIDKVVADLEQGHILTGLLNKVLAGYLGSSHSTCKGTPAPPKSSDNSPSTEFLVWVIGCSVTALFMIVGIVIYLVRRRRASRLQTLYSKLNSDEEAKAETRLMCVDGFRADDHSRLARFNAWMQGSLLFEDGHIALWVRILIPLIVLLNCVLFLSSNLGLGAAVKIKLEYSDVVVFSADTFDFSLGNSVRDMWTAKVYALSLLIAVCSGAWPYSKLLLVLVCWCLPPAALPLKHRGKLLEALDALGKWSLVDSFVLVMMMVAFRFHIGIPPVSMDGVLGLPGNLIALDVIVQAGWGFYGFLLATISSLIVSHVCIAFHRAAVYGTPGEIEEQAKKDGTEEKLKLKEALMNHTFKVPRGYTWTVCGRIVVGFTIVFTFVLILVGSVIDVYSFEFEGATSFLPLRSFSLYSTATAISKTDDGFGIRAIQVTFILFGMIIPLIHMVSLLFLWIVPLSLRRQHYLFVITEVLNAWSALEVFVVSIICALLELPTFAQFILGDKCNIPNDIISTMDHFQPNPINIGHGEDKCFDVKATLEDGCWVLFAAMLIAVLIIQLITRSCAQAMDERLFRATRRVSRASALEHLDSEALRHSLDPHEGETCREGCRRRNLACNHSVNVAFFGCLAAVNLVSLKDDTHMEQLEAAGEADGSLAAEAEDLENSGQYESYSDYANRTSSRASDSRESSPEEDEPLAHSTH